MLETTRLRICQARPTQVAARYLVIVVGFLLLLLNFLYL